MATRGAPLGNQNGKKGRMVYEALRKIAVRDEMPPAKTNMDRLARVMWTKAEEGDTSMVREICDRLEGKPHQTSETTIDGNLTVELVRFANPHT